MTLKKLVLITFIGLMPAQFVLCINQIRSFPPFYASKNVVLATLVGSVLAGTALGYLSYRKIQEEKAECDSWNNKSEEEIRVLVTLFMNKVEKRLAVQLKRLRYNVDMQENCAIKGSLKCFYYIRKTIGKCDLWLSRIQNRELNPLVQQITLLKSELIYLINTLNIYIDKDFIVAYEKLSMKRPIIIPLYIPS